MSAVLWNDKHALMTAPFSCSNGYDIEVIG